MSPHATAWLLSPLHLGDVRNPSEPASRSSHRLSISLCSRSTSASLAGDSFVPETCFRRAWRSVNQRGLRAAAISAFGGAVDANDLRPVTSWARWPRGIRQARETKFLEFILQLMLICSRDELKRGDVGRRTRRQSVVTTASLGIVVMMSNPAKLSSAPFSALQFG